MTRLLRVRGTIGGSPLCEPPVSRPMDCFRLDRSVGFGLAKRLFSDPDLALVRSGGYLRPRRPAQKPARPRRPARGSSGNAQPACGANWAAAQVFRRDGRDRPDINETRSAFRRSPFRFSPASAPNGNLVHLRKNKPWTEADTERLKAMIASGASAFRAAAAFNRGVNDIRTRARNLGTPFPTVREAKKEADRKSTGNSRRAVFVVIDLAGRLI